VRILGRFLAFLVALPLLAGGFAGLSVHLVAEEKRDTLRQNLLKQVGEDKQALVNLTTVTLEPSAAHGTLLGFGGLLLLYGVWPRGGEKKSRSKSQSKKAEKGSKTSGKKARKRTAVDVGEPEAEAAGAGSGSSLSKKEMRRVQKLAKTVEDEHGPEAAGDFLLQESLAEEAAELFERSGLMGRVAEVRHDQNRFEEAAEAYEQSERWESAGGIYQQIDKFEEAARCYVKADKLSVAGEMFERAGNHRDAGGCYRDIGFHRHAAQAFLKGNCDADAAESLVAAFTEEGAGNAGNEQQQRELRSIAKKAGELFYKLERFEEAETILVRAGAFASAAKVAFHTGAFDRASELFLRIGRGDLAAKALEKLDNPTAAAKALGEYLRDKGELAEAVPHLEQAGEHQEAGDLYRQLDQFDKSGECYLQIGDYPAAAEMFRAADKPREAAQAYERAGQFDLAAKCMGQAGEVLLQADLLEKAGEHFEAGKAYAEHDKVDEAIRVLQLVEVDNPHFSDVCAVLGGLFQQKGMHSLSVKKFEEATADQPVTRENVAAYYQLAQAHEARDEFGSAAEIYEKILAFDYHYENVSAKLEEAKQRHATTPEPSEPNPKSAQSTGRYQVVREIGRGGMGVVHLARDTVLEREVAYKVLPEQLRQNPNALKNFLREAKAAAQLNHPNIVTVYDAGESEHGFYLAMELVEGTTLKEIVQRRGAVSPGGVLYILRQMADALAYAHSKKVVHRDIKTANTMWTPGRQVKIMDFGLAKLMEEVRNATTVVSGTPFYMSPEQTLGRNVDHRTDLYSLGVTLFELATGQLPFRRGNVPYHHVHTPPPTPKSVNPNVPDKLEKIILRLLEKSPEDRYQSAKELVTVCDEIAAADSADSA
jgi:tetratricopeptide (TPR) repeat protein